MPRNIGYARAAEMLFTSRVLDARTAMEWGLVSRVVAPERLVRVRIEGVAQASLTTQVGANQETNRTANELSQVPRRLGVRGANNLDAVVRVRAKHVLGPETQHRLVLNGCWSDGE